MALYPAGYESEDDFGDFLSDNDQDDEIDRLDFNAEGANEPVELTLEQKLNKLFFAILNGALTEVILALNEGVDVNVYFRDGWTPVLLAASVGNAEIVLELIDRGANVNLDKDKYTPLMAVCVCPDSTSTGLKRLEIINALIEHGAAVEAITRKRQTALMYAASSGNLQILERLIQICDINAEDNQGWTALFWAVDGNKPDAVKFLLDTGLSPLKLDIRGYTPLHYAITQDYESIVDILSLPDEEKPFNDINMDLYNIEDLFRDLSPRFSRDISGMLYGMRCEHLLNYFSNMDLLEFLCLDDNGLEEIGIELPYQRYRILTGLHKFHGHVYKQKSIPIVPKDALYSTIDVGNALVAAIRQLIAMEASINYITRIGTDKNLKPMEIPLRTIRIRIQRIKKTSKALNVLANQWDSAVQPVDFISKENNYSKPRNWFNYVGCFSALTFTIIILFKTRI